MVKKPIGRPKKDENLKQVKPIKILLTSEQAKQIADEANNKGLSVSSYIRLKLNL